MQSFKKIYSVVMKLNRLFALHVFANDLYKIFAILALEAWSSKIKAHQYLILNTLTFAQLDRGSDKKGEAGEHLRYNSMKLYIVASY